MKQTLGSLMYVSWVPIMVSASIPSGLLTVPAACKLYVFDSSRAWRLRNATFSIVLAVGGPETLRFPQFPPMAAQKHYVFRSSRAWRLGNIMFSIVAARGGSET